MVVGSRILVVDDEPDLCLLYQEVLQDEGYDVETATSGAHALDDMDEFHPDLLVMDTRGQGDRPES